MNTDNRRQRWISLLAGAIVTYWISACSDEQAEFLSEEIKIMSNTPTSSRPPRSKIKPIVQDGVRYEEDKVFDEDGDQNGGYLAAFDTKSGEKLWRLKVYEVTDYSNEGVVNIGLYFRSMKLLAESSEIEVVNEAGGRYRIDLSNRTSTYVDGPESVTDEEPEPDTRPAPPPL
jgi:outer membrane protein assembly factor BamB